MSQTTDLDRDRLAAALARLLAGWWRSEQQRQTLAQNAEVDADANGQRFGSATEARSSRVGVATLASQEVEA